MSCGNVPDAQGTAEEEQTLMPRRREVRRVDKGICQRCQVAKSIFIIRSATYCVRCFHHAVQMRFTRLLYPPLQSDRFKPKSSQRSLYRPPLQPGNVLIALSGGAGSMAMLDMLCEGGYIGKGDGGMVPVADKTKGEKGLVWRRGTVVHIDFSGVVGDPGTAQEMANVVRERGGGLRFVGLRAEDVFDPRLRARIEGLGKQGSEVVSSAVALQSAGAEAPALSMDTRDPALTLSEPSSPKTTTLSSLLALLCCLPPPSRPAFLSNILHALLTITAQSLPDVSHLLLGETSTRQAERVISGTALGRGWSLPLDLAASIRLPGVAEVTRLNPMKDVTVKEAAFLCHVRSLETRNHRGWGNGRRDGKDSIEGLTEEFIAKLNVTHPSTVYTINRTGGKLVFPGKTVDADLCPVCQMPVDPSALAWKSRTALTSLSPQNHGEERSCQRDGLASTLCYACLTTFTPAIGRRGGSAGETVRLPGWIAEGVESCRSDKRRANKEVGREAMRVEIEDFLIPGGDEGS